MTTTSNKQIGDAITKLGAAIADLGHLPKLESVQWLGDQPVSVDVVRRYDDLPAELRDRLAWAEAFATSVRVSFHSGDIDTFSVAVHFDLAGFKVQLSKTYYNESAEAMAETASRLGLNEGRTELRPQQFAAFVDQLARPYAERRWRAAYDRHYQQSIKYGARDEDARAYADGKTVDELGPMPTVDEGIADSAAPVEHRHVSGSIGGPGENAAVCACGVGFSGFDSPAEAREQLDLHIEDERVRVAGGSDG